MKIIGFGPHHYVTVNAFIRTGQSHTERKGPHHGPLRPGGHIMVRWGDTWNHAKVTLIRQEGVRISSQRAVDMGKPRLYVTGYRMQFSVWRNRVGRQGQAAKWGVMVYGTPFSKVHKVLKQRRRRKR